MQDTPCQASWLDDNHQMMLPSSAVLLVQKTDQSFVAVHCHYATVINAFRSLTLRHFPFEYTDMRLSLILRLCTYDMIRKDLTCSQKMTHSTRSNTRINNALKLTNIQDTHTLNTIHIFT